MESAFALEYRLFTFTDPISPIPRTRIIEPRLVSGAASVSLSYATNPETFRLSFDGTEFVYTADDLTVTGNDRLYRNGEFALAMGPINDSDTQVMIVSHRWPPEAFTDNTEVGTAQKFIVSPIGNVSVEQTEIESPIIFEGRPALAAGDVGISESTISVTTNGITNTGFGVNGSFHLQQVVNNAVDFIGEVRVAATLNPETNMIHGKIVDPGNSDAEIGSVHGALFGPNRAFMGIVFEFDSPQGVPGIRTGWLLAPRQ